MSSQDPPLDLIQSIINLHTDRKSKLALSNAHKLLEQFPSSAITLNIIGAISAELSQFDQAKMIFSPNQEQWVESCNNLLYFIHAYIGTTNND